MLAYEAQFEGECPKCTHLIRPGQRIIKNSTGEWKHTKCPPKPTVCTKCFLQKPCGCDS